MKNLVVFINIFLIALIFISCNKEVSTSPPEPVPQKTGKLFVDSNPGGAKIYLNDKNTGFITPDTVPYLVFGTYKLTAKLNLYKDSSEIVVIKKDSLTSVFLDYTINPTMKGYLNVDSYPQGASIILNDTATGKTTPFEFSNVLPDTYNVVLQKTGYWSSNYSAVVKTNRTTRIYGSLEDTSVFVNYRMSNSDIPSDYLSGVTIDQDGNIWVVDSYSLTKFDGINWVSYDPDNSGYPGGNINSIDAFGDEVWVSSSNGLIIYKNGAFEFMGTQSGLPSNYIYCVLKVNENDIWAGTSAGLCHFGGSVWQVYNTENSGLPLNNISSVKIDNNNNVWIGTVGGGVVRYDGTNWDIFNSYNSDLPESNKVTDIEIINGSTVWVSFSSMGQTALGGTAVFDGTQWNSFKLIPSQDVSGIISQTNDLIWFGNTDQGLSKYENGAWHTFLTSNSQISSNRVFDVAVGQNGYKWIATYGGGLSKYKGN